MKVICLDTENSKLPYSFPWQAQAFPVAWGIKSITGEYKSWVFTHDQYRSEKTMLEQLDEIQAEILSANVLVGHNLKYDINWLRWMGIDFSNVKLHCTQLAEYLINGQRPEYSLSLDSVSKVYGISPKKDKVKMFWESGYETSEIPLDILLPYLEQDCINPLVIYSRQVDKLKELNLSKLNTLHTELLRVLSEIECNGMKFDKEKALSIIEEYRGKQEDIYNVLYQYLGSDINLNSGDELSAALFGGVIKREGKEKVIKHYKYGDKIVERKCVNETKIQGAGFQPPKGSELKKVGYFATSKDVIKQLSGKTPAQKKIKEALLERSNVQKVLETFQGDGEDKGLVNKIQVDGCVHPKYNQTVTKTGRLSSQDPNGQNLPRGKTSPIKQVIVPRHDIIINADLSQIEWRVAGFLSQDPIILKEIRDNVDTHSDNAINILGIDPTLQRTDPELFSMHRTDAKIVTFRLLYGGSAYAFYMDQNMPNYSLKKWEGIVNKFYDKYKGLAKWQLDNIRKVNATGQLVSPTGRIFKFNKVQNKQGVWLYREQQIKNYPVQSLATADIMPLALVVIQRRYAKYGIKSKIIAQVHDSIVHDAYNNEVRPIAKICIEVFESLPELIEQTWGFKFNVPLTGEIEVGPTYADVKKFKL